jgi:hypothetical protein
MTRAGVLLWVEAREIVGKGVLAGTRCWSQAGPYYGHLTGRRHKISRVYRGPNGFTRKMTPGGGYARTAAPCRRPGSLPLGFDSATPACTLWPPIRSRRETLRANQTT